MQLFQALGAVLVLSTSGCNSSADQPATTYPPADSTARATISSPPPTAARQPGQDSPVSLAGRTFSLKSFPVERGTGVAPQFNIYLYPSQLTDSVLVAQDTEPSVLTTDQGARLGVPKTAVIYFQTYYAGAGNKYYAVADGPQLRVYRRYMEEATPENEHQPLPDWQLLKTFGFFKQGVRELPPEPAGGRGDAN